MAIPIKARGFSAQESLRRRRVRRSVLRRMRRAWSLWLMYFADWRLLQFILPSQHRSFISARAARAALDELPVSAATSTNGRSGGWRESLPATLPLRYAAHAIAVVLVAFVVLWPFASAPAALPAPALVLPAAASVDLADPQDVPVLATDAVAPAAPVVPLDAPTTNDTQARAASSFVTIYSLREGERLGDVAQRFGVSVDSLFWMNNLQNVDMLVPDQALRVPPVSGLIHVVQTGETTQSIAQASTVPVEAIVMFAANNLRADSVLQPGREIFVPGATQPYPQEALARLGGEQGIANMQAVQAITVRETGTSLRIGPSKMYDRVAKLDAGRQLKLLGRHDDWVKVQALGQDAGWVRSDLLVLPTGALDTVAESSDFPPLPPVWVWPARGALTSPFGWRFVPFRSFHDGLDIANVAGTRISAARAGRVIEAGWCSGFGYCVKIDHGDSMVSIYGHLLRQPSVRVGQNVDAGDPIGLMGSTFDRSGGGYSTGVHLHFTVKINGTAVNPMNVLP